MDCTAPREVTLTLDQGLSTVTGSLIWIGITGICLAVGGRKIFYPFSQITLCEVTQPAEA